MRQMRRLFSTEALARNSARHPWRVIAIWVVLFLIGGTLMGQVLPDVQTTEFAFTNSPDSDKAHERLEERLRGLRGTNEIAIVESENLTVDDPAFEAAVTSLTEQISALGPEVIKEGTLTNFYLSGDESFISQDRRTTVIPFTLAGEFDETSEHIEDVVPIIHTADENPEVRVLITGQATVNLDFREVSEKDLVRGETIGVPIALIILILVLGALVASLLPIVQAFVAIVIAMGAAALVGQVFLLSFFVTNMITMIGLAVGIDYSLFILARYREERSRGLDKLDAISRSGATATRAVFFSGMTVFLALIGMLLVPSNVFISLGLGAILVVIASVAAAMTLLPAILSLLGDKVNAGTIPVIGQMQHHFDEEKAGGFWDRVSHAVMDRAVISLVVFGALMLFLASWFFQMNTGASGISTLPEGLESKEGFDIIDEKFSFGEVTPAEIVIDGDVDSEPVQAAIDDLVATLASDPEFGEPRPLEVNEAGDLAALSVPVAGDPAGGAAEAAVRRLRSDYIPDAFSGVDADVYVGGETAFNIDFFDLAADATPIVFGFVLSVSFILLMLVFRSIVVPAKAILLNLLSVGATYGLLVLVFQEGFLNEVFGFEQADTIEAWIPLFLFSVLFGLSMDYHVFLLSRIREHYDQTGNNTESVAFGIRSTGRLITGAALIMVAVFWGFAAGDLVGLQQMGFGLGIAVLLDATIVRMVLVPASMRLLGNWNWYLPSALHWLPDLRVEPAGGHAGEGSPAGS
jgi:RND superfamily putative drug exporter